jgi:hypothetical protein
MTGGLRVRGARGTKFELGELESQRPLTSERNMNRLTMLAMACAPLAACSGGLGAPAPGSSTSLESVTFSTAPPGTPYPHLDPQPGESRWFLVDDNADGTAPELLLAALSWGRLVEVEALDAAGRRRLQQHEFVIAPDLVGDGVDYLLEENPVIGGATLVILRDITDASPGGGRAQYFDLLRAAEANLVPVPDAGLPAGPGAYPLLPRNAALVARFDDLLEQATIDATTVRVVTGLPSTIPFEARVLIDRNHGDFEIDPLTLDRIFRPTRVVIDPTVDEREALQSGAALPLNPIGLPPSTAVDFSNVSLRLPSQVSVGVGQPEVLRTISGAALAVSGNGSVDFASATLDIVRAMRSGGDQELTGDLFNGFLPDTTPPLPVGLAAVTLQSPPALDPSGDGLDFILRDTTFVSPDCDFQPGPGDVIAQPGALAVVTQIPSTLQGLVVHRMRVRLVAGDAQAWIAQGGGAAELLSAYDAARHVGAEACFARITPPASGAPLAPTRGLATSSTVGMRFGEPLDARSALAYDALLLVRSGPLPPPGSGTGYEPVLGDLVANVSATEWTVVPARPLAHAAGAPDAYVLQLGAGALAPRDLAGNLLSVTLAPVDLALEPSAAPVKNGGHVTRFAGVDEFPPIGGGAGPLPEWSGQHVYDLAREVVRPRPVVFFQASADRNGAMLGSMTPFPPGVQGPLTALGAKAQSVWRYADVGFSLLDLPTLNLDVAGLYWSPAGAQVIADSFGEFEIRMSHAGRSPDEVVDPLSLLPAAPSSGLLATYDANALDLVNDAPAVVHPRQLGYTVNPGDLMTSSQGTPLMPYPLNRGLPVDQYAYYTWRDTSLRARAGDGGLGVPLQQEYVVGGKNAPSNPVFGAGQVRSIGLPLLLEFRCYPDAGALGLNAFDVSLATNSSSRPYFRAFSAGGVDTLGNLVLVDPDLETQANGGYNPNSSPPGLPTYGRDNAVFIGAVDLVVRVSRSHSVWIPAREVAGGPPFLDPDYDLLQPVADLPPGTALRIDVRGARLITAHPQLPNQTHPALVDALTLDAYGDHYDDTTIPPGGQVAHDAPRENLGITFHNQTDAWFADLDAIDGALYVQLRVTFEADPRSGRTPTLHALAVGWSD